MCPSFRIFLPELLIYVSIYYSADAAKWRDLDPRVLRYSRSEEQRSDERHKQLPRFVVSRYIDTRRIIREIAIVNSGCGGARIIS